ncbi:MAG: replicative DNA helicase [Rhodospirillales bacterium]|nr:replicative DNA helicase [Rhodospirillales bacterium]
MAEPIKHPALEQVENDNLGSSANSGLRTPPHNYEAEKALLGAIFANNKAYEKVSEFLRPNQFADPIHGKIYEAAALLLERGQIANPVTLNNYFQRDEVLAEIGGVKYLAELAASAVTIINAAEYGRIIHDLHLKRELVSLGEDVVNDAFGSDLEASAMNQIETAEQRLYTLASTGETEGGFKLFKESLIETIHIAEIAHKRDGGLAGVTTGLRDLDKSLGGLHPSDLLILAARPSMGKTALCTNIAYKAAEAHMKSNGEEGGVVAFFSLEMSADQLAARILSERTSISSDGMRKGNLSDEEFDRLVLESQHLYKLPLYIDDTPALTVSALRTRARRLQRQNGLGMIIVDYLQLLSPPANGSSQGNRVQEVSEMTRGLKGLAKELQVPVIALSQLSRAVESREDKRPQLSDLRESGSIEQDADVVMFIFREEYYLQRSEPLQRAEESADKYAERYEHWAQRCQEVGNKAELIVAKQRHGPIGNIGLFFDGQFARFGDLADDAHIPDH